MNVEGIKMALHPPLITALTWWICCRVSERRDLRQKYTLGKKPVHHRTAITHIHTTGCNQEFHLGQTMVLTKLFLVFILGKSH